MSESFFSRSAKTTGSYTVLQNVAVVGQDFIARPQGVEVQAGGAVVAAAGRVLHVAARVDAPFLRRGGGPSWV